ncbi:acrylate utilization transcriptional regulator AcuR [Thalassotalea sediminis]|uniref:acrylate utilization transcriptional regulator AcuR n=1 Tax=Thalassotalea sediminis TaxID=1759089 RepID=UPI0025729F83|nr:TetR/AcrR family transcriptional regulator [Thalassotalea sediminis]
MTLVNNKPRRGRPPKASRENRDTKADLIRSGLEQLTESGFASSGIDKILKKVGVPKGSFYFYFSSKEAFGHAVIDSYARYFETKLERYLLDTDYSPLHRINNFVEDAKHGMTKHQFKRGCLVGNLGQEVDLLPTSYRQRLIEIFIDWQKRMATCLKQAQESGEIATTVNCQNLAEYFWTGWEGAVSRAKLEQSTRPLDVYLDNFISGLPR